MKKAIDILIDTYERNDSVFQFKKDVLLHYILPRLDSRSSVGLATFIASNNFKGGMSRRLVPAVKTQHQLASIVKEIPFKNYGGMPISTAIDYSLRSMNDDYKDHAPCIILLLDGRNSFPDNYVSYIRQVLGKGYSFQLIIVGFGLNQQQREQAFQAKELTNGEVILLLLDSFYTHSALTKHFDLFEQALYFGTSPLPTRADIIHPASIQHPESLEQRVSNTQTASAMEPIGKTAERPESWQNELLADCTAEEDPELIRIGLKCEEYLYNILLSKYGSKTKWISKEEPTADHDFEIQGDNQETELYIECKGTAGDKTTFWLTVREWHLFRSNPDRYHIYFVQHCDTNQPNHIYIDHLWNWLQQGKIVPYSPEQTDYQAKRVLFRILKA